MPSLADRIGRFAAQHLLWSAETRVVAAVSGGSDSVALFRLLQELAGTGALRLAGLIHLHHHIRGQAADADAAFCRELAAGAGVPVMVGDADVPALARERGVSLEVAGRDARQQFYLSALGVFAATHVAVAHTRDDQAETVLLRLVRGAGPAGLSGIAPRRDHLVRPLLELTRAELRCYLTEINAPWREDATNADIAIPRNRIRHLVLPQLRELNAQAEAAIARAADIVRTDAVFLDELANEAAVRLVRVDAVRAGGAGGELGVFVDAAELVRLPLALARRVALRALETANPSRSYGLEEASIALRGGCGRCPRQSRGARHGTFRRGCCLTS